MSQTPRKPYSAASTKGHRNPWGFQCRAYLGNMSVMQCSLCLPCSLYSQTELCKKYYPSLPAAFLYSSHVPPPLLSVFIAPKCSQGPELFHNVFHNVFKHCFGWEMVEWCHYFSKYWELFSKLCLVAVARSKCWQRQTQGCLAPFLNVCGWLVVF